MSRPVYKINRNSRQCFATHSNHHLKVVRPCQTAGVTAACVMACHHNSIEVTDSGCRHWHQFQSRIFQQTSFFSLLIIGECQIDCYLPLARSFSQSWTKFALNSPLWAVITALWTPWIDWCPQFWRVVFCPQYLNALKFCPRVVCLNVFKFSLSQWVAPAPASRPPRRRRCYVAQAGRHREQAAAPVSMKPDSELLRKVVSFHVTDRVCDGRYRSLLPPGSSFKFDRDRPSESPEHDHLCAGLRRRPGIWFRWSDRHQPECWHTESPSAWGWAGLPPRPCGRGCSAPPEWSFRPAMAGSSSCREAVDVTAYELCLIDCSFLEFEVAT